LNFYLYEEDENAALAKEKSSSLHAANAELLRENEKFACERKAVESSFMKRPLSAEKTFAYFGVMLGALPLAAICTRFLIDRQFFRLEDVWFLGVVFIVSLISATVGYFSGKSVGRAVSDLEKASWSKMILVSPFIGAAWGIAAGGAGGIIIFFVGAFFGAIVGGAVGAVALPVFTVFHRLLKRGDQIDAKHFLPLAFGTTLTILAFVVGL